MSGDRHPYQFSFRDLLYAPNEAVTLKSGEDFVFGVNCFRRSGMNDLTIELLDLMRVATSIYVTDRLVRRHRDRNGLRHIEVTVPVADIATWSRDDVQDVLHDMLSFLSGGDDDWLFRFEPLTLKVERQQVMFPRVGTVVLHSGGLDSCAGLTIRRHALDGQLLMPATICHQAGQRKLVGDQRSLIERVPGTELSPMQSYARLRWHSRLNGWRQERTQRCRSVLFGTMGAIAARLSGGRSVEFCESGIGAMNVPLLPGMLGHRATRGSHPEFLRKLQRLIALVTGEQVDFRLPFLRQTKAEMCRQLKDLGGVEVAAKSASCVHYPMRDSQAKQCGTCPACVLRRQSLFVAGLDDNGSAYGFDVFNQDRVTSDWQSHRFDALRAFLTFSTSLRTVESGGGVGDRVGRHLVHSQVVAKDDSQAEQRTLLGRYRDEWSTLIRELAARNIEWAQTIQNSIKGYHYHAIAS